MLKINTIFNLLSLKFKFKQTIQWKNSKRNINLYTTNPVWMKHLIYYLMKIRKVFLPLHNSYKKYILLLIALRTLSIKYNIRIRSVFKKHIKLFLQNAIVRNLNASNYTVNASQEVKLFLIVRIIL